MLLAEARESSNTKCLILEASSKSLATCCRVPGLCHQQGCPGSQPASVHAAWCHLLLAPFEEAVTKNPAAAGAEAQATNSHKRAPSSGWCFHGFAAKESPASVLCSVHSAQGRQRSQAASNNKEKELPGSSAAEPKLLDTWQRCMQVTREGKVESAQQAATKFAVWLISCTLHWMEVVWHWPQFFSF